MPAAENSPPALSSLTTMGLGGHAKRLTRLDREDDLPELVIEAERQGLPLLPLGGGSNVVVADGGVSAWVVLMELSGLEVQGDGPSRLVTAGAGENWHEFVMSMTERGLAGVECLAGIPGKVGAAPIQNVGAYGQEVSETVHSLRLFDLQTRQVLDMAGSACDFGYRHSRFKAEDQGRYVVLAVSFRLRAGGRASLGYGELQRSFGAGAQPSLREVRDAVVELRRAKSMVYDPSDENHRSCGSFFVNCLVGADDLVRIEQAAAEAPPHFAVGDGRYKIPSAWLIERAGISRGLRRGSVGISSKHTLCLVAHDGATSRELVRLAAWVRDQVDRVFGVELVPEPNFWGYGTLRNGLPRL